jgi:hypothetical protein
MLKKLYNSAEWLKDSDEWVKTMEASRINKAEYRKYLMEYSKQRNADQPLLYRHWLRNQL